MALLNNIIIAFLDTLTVKLVEHINWHGLGIRILGSTFILFATHLLHNNVQNSHRAESLKDGWLLTLYQWWHGDIGLSPYSSVANECYKHPTLYMYFPKWNFTFRQANCYFSLLRFPINMYTLRDYLIWDCLKVYSSPLKDNMEQMKMK